MSQIQLLLDGKPYTTIVSLDELPELTTELLNDGIITDPKQISIDKSELKEINKQKRAEYIDESISELGITARDQRILNQNASLVALCWISQLMPVLAESTDNNVAKVAKSILPLSEMVRDACTNDELITDVVGTEKVLTKILDLSRTTAIVIKSK